MRDDNPQITQIEVSTGAVATGCCGRTTCDNPMITRSLPLPVLTRVNRRNLWMRFT